MRIPKVISKNNSEYIFVKEYKDYIMYKNMLTGVNECFHRQELGLLNEMIKTSKTNINVEKVKI